MDGLGAESEGARRSDVGRRNVMTAIPSCIHACIPHNYCSHSTTKHRTQRRHPSTMAATYLKFQPADRIVLNLASNEAARTVISVENTSACSVCSSVVGGGRLGAIGGSAV